MDSFIPISRLLAGGRPPDHPVAYSVRGLETWEAFQGAVRGLGRRLEAAEGRNWLIVCEDAYALAVALLAALHGGRRVVFPANLQEGHLAELAAKVEGVLAMSAAGLPEGKVLEVFADGEEDKDWSFGELDAEACEIELHTSGSTGRPEAVLKPLRCLESEVEVLEAIFGSTGAESVLATVPAYHIYGLLFRVLWPLSSGRTLEAQAIAFPEELIALAAQRPAPALVSSPAFLRRALPILDLQELGRYLRGAFSSGGPLPPDVAAAYNTVLDCDIVEVYGSTETGGIARRVVVDAVAPPPWAPMPGVAVGLAEDGQTITVRSPFLATDGVFETGDHGEILADGRFVLRGRKDRIVKLEERRVSLIEIEERLRRHDEVIDVRVLPLEASGARTTLGAVVVPSEQGWLLIESTGKRTLRERLHRALKPHLETLALPRRWRFVRRLPESAQGKITAAALADLFQGTYGRRTEPEITGQISDAARVTLGMRLDPKLIYFDGHFEAAAILPGVAQVDWAIQQARKWFSIRGPFQRIEALKFFHVIPAGACVEMALEFDAEKGRLTFQYRRGDVTHSSGRIRFEPAS
ncbi:AMP-binding protein [Pelagibius sp. 7325]|uniref:AMP-binding protein n=1 Tax=Pelagibius sp. 7325 TaxID=3131994 RepID=UPI0030EE5250